MALTDYQSQQLQHGRTDLILCLPASQCVLQPELLSLACYYGDVSALRYLLLQGYRLIHAGYYSRQ